MPRRTSPLILVIDADPMECARVFDMLEQAGFRSIAAGPWDAVNLLEITRPVLAISELFMTDVQDFTFLRRAMRTSPDTRFIFMSRVADGALRERVIEQGGADLLRKPVREQDLFRSVARIFAPFPAEAPGSPGRMAGAGQGALEGC